MPIYKPYTIALTRAIIGVTGWPPQPLARASAKVPIYKPYTIAFTRAVTGVSGWPPQPLARVPRASPEILGRDTLEHIKCDDSYERTTGLFYVFDGYMYDT